MYFQIPPPALLDAWRRGDTPISNDDLDMIETFFDHLAVGCEALGERFSLATEALRREHERAQRIQNFRMHI